MKQRKTAYSPAVRIPSEVVAMIAADTRPARQIADAFRVSRTAVWRIKTGRVEAGRRRPAVPAERVRERLSADQVRAIASDPRTKAEVAAAFGCSEHYVWSIKNGRARRSDVSVRVPAQSARGRLSPDQVRAIRRDKRSAEAVASDHDVSVRTVYRVKAGRFYRHV